MIPVPWTVDEVQFASMQVAVEASCLQNLKRVNRFGLMVVLISVQKLLNEGRGT